MQCKKCITRTVGAQKLSYNEMQTFIFEVGNLLNERPMGKIPSSDHDGSYLSPNDCLLGRTSIKAPCEFNETRCSKKRIWFVQIMTDVFWKKWVTFYLASLVTRKTRHHEQRNLTVNDIVIIYDKDI